MNFDVLITGLASIISAVVGSTGGWLFARKKYNSEVDSKVIANMKDALDFYKRLSDDNKERLNELTKRNDALEKEVSDLRSQMFNLLNSICVNLACEYRQRDLNLFSKLPIKNETTTEEKSDEK